MTHKIETIALPAMSPGTQRILKVHRYGAIGARPKVYIQAALHADELSGMLAAHHLLQRLNDAAARGEIKGGIVLVPAANPIGLSQNVLTVHAGARYVRTGGDFNRHWPDLFADLPAAIEGKLGKDATENVAVIRAALRAKIELLEQRDELSALRRALLLLSHDADIVLDLHCDDEALPHVFMMPQHWPAGADLAAETGAAACVLCDDSGLQCFDETNSLPFTRLAKLLGDRFPVPPACFAATVEFRGQSDVFDELAERDAGGLYRFLQRRGIVAGNPGPMAEPCAASPLDRADYLHAPVAGLIAYKVALGDHVGKGDLIAEVVDPLADDPMRARTPVHAATDGLVISRCLKKLAAPGDSIGIVVGTAP
ncbi:MAG TPA: succinylglutamate desuccinylase/aspartoacylase family protein [Dongiaceae bacterium]|nr:succinylglutamate desuccinylase/aspartoacylase family protein [Dongiaceae bacterium]